MSWSTFKSIEGQIISINMDEVVAVVNYPSDRADICLRNGYRHSVIFMGEWKTQDQYNEDLARANMDIQNRDDEIQDLKLENDRLKQRDEIMVKFIRSVKCIGIICDKCDFHDDSRHCCMFDHGSMSQEVSDLYMVFSDKADEILERLDNL